MSVRLYKPTYRVDGLWIIGSAWRDIDRTLSRCASKSRTLVSVNKVSRTLFKKTVFYSVTGEKDDLILFAKLLGAFDDIYKIEHPTNELHFENES